MPRILGNSRDADYKPIILKQRNIFSLESVPYMAGCAELLLNSLSENAVHIQIDPLVFPELSYNMFTPAGEDSRGFWINKFRQESHASEKQVSGDDNLLRHFKSLFSGKIPSHVYIARDPLASLQEPTEYLVFATYR
jgi:hypothetical protein